MRNSNTHLKCSIKALHSGQIDFTSEHKYKDLSVVMVRSCGKLTEVKIGSFHCVPTGNIKTKFFNVASFVHSGFPGIEDL